jgi:ATP-dependent exoDNAse (exonuclease V) alpha subunit
MERDRPGWRNALCISSRSALRGAQHRRAPDAACKWRAALALDRDKALPWAEQRIGLALAESQVAAIQLALKSKVLVMTGGPGVGKTTIVRGILRILAAKGTNLLLCAPTGRGPEVRRSCCA